MWFLMALALTANPGNTIAWDAPPEIVTRYEVSWDNGTTWASVGLNLSAPVPSVLNVYAFKVRACNDAGCGPSLDETVTVTETQAPPPTGPRVISVPAGGDVQAALNACQAGEVVQIEAGATFTGSYVLVPKSAPGCVLTSSATLPARRLTPNDRSLLPTLRSGSDVLSPLTGLGATHWTIDGIAFESNPTGEGDVVVLEDAQNIILDRLLIIAGPNGQKRWIRGNGQAITLTRSHCAGVWKAGQDSQCFAAWDGAGPYTIRDNYLEAASENVMFGGSDSKSVDRIPSDILIDGNHFSKDLAWKGQPRNVKNLLELKSAKRVTIRNNVFERGWADGQSGLGLLFSTLNDDGGSPWAIVSDVLVEKNIIRDIEGLAIGISGKSWMADQPTQQGTRYTIRDNDITVTGRAFHLSNNIGVASIENNRVQNGDYALFVNGEPWAVDNLTFRRNTFTNPAMGWDGEGCLSCTTWEQALPHFIQVYNGNWTTPTLPPVNCVVSSWSLSQAGAWSACVDGTQTRTETWTRSIVTPPANGGTACPVLTETRTGSQSCTVPVPIDVCVADPIVLTVTAWPTKNQKTRADFTVKSPRGPATVTFTFAGQRSVSATATDGTCTVTVMR